MYSKNGLERLNPGIFAVNGSGTVEYNVKVYRNTGNWKGFVAETDDGTRVHVPSGHMGNFRSAVNEATQRVMETCVGYSDRCTQVKGERDGVYLADEKDSVRISDSEARKLADEVDSFIQKESFLKESGNKLR